MVFEEGMHAHTRVIAEQTPDLFFIQAPRLIPFEGNLFEQMTRNVLPR